MAATKNSQAQPNSISNVDFKSHSPGFWFRDIEHALNSFSGNDKGQKDEKWLEEFEKFSEMFKWNDLQKLIHAKRLMKDSAKLELGSIKTLTYDDFKRALLHEFGKNLTSNEVHKILESKKKKKDENIRDYTLKMREIGMVNGIDEQSVIHYVINGIDAEHSTKAILYGAKTYDELKI